MTKTIKSQLFRIIPFAILLAVLGYRFYQVTYGSLFPNRIEAVGNLLITYLGIPLGDPVFEVTNMLPGDCQVRTIDAQNSGLDDALVAVRSDNEQDPDGLSTQLYIRIIHESADIYGGSSITGPKTVAQFFSDSDTLPDGIRLSTLNPNTQTSYQFEVCFDSNTGNEYQQTQTIFDLIFGEIIVPIRLPAECSHLEGLVTEIITGTEDDDYLEGTSANEYIRGLGGHDIIIGSGGHDCLEGGAGDDDLDAGTGNDVLIGGAGNDHLDGHSDNDLIYGSDGDDFIEGKEGVDTIYAGIGNDRVEAGSGNDLIYGEDGNDWLEGGSDNDTVYGENGNDTLRGNSGNDSLYGGNDDDTINGNSGDDYLDGGPGTDSLDGDSDSDTCVFGETLNSCEF